MKYIPIIKDNNNILAPILLDAPEYDYLPEVERYYIEVEDDYIFDNEAVITIETDQDKDSLVTEFTINKDYTSFDKWIDKESDILINEWCESQGKNESYYQRKGIDKGKENADFITYKNKVNDIITSQAKLKKGS